MNIMKTQIPKIKFQIKNNFQLFKFQTVWNFELICDLYFVSLEINKL